MASNWTMSAGTVLLNDLRDMHISQKELAEKTGVPRSVINEIIKGKRKMTVDFAMKLEPIFGPPAEYWLSIQNEYEIAKRKQSIYIVTRDNQIIQNGKNSARDVAHWFINRAAKDAENDAGEYMTPLKLQKLLYFVQARALKMREQAMFYEPILHWEYGPVVRCVYDEYKDHKGTSIVSAPEVRLDPSDVKLMEQTYKNFLSYSANGLVTLTHQKKSWQETSNGEEMTLEMIVND